MSNMASEMAARMREEGRDPDTERITPTAPLEGGAAEPGTGREPAPTSAAPPAEALNTDTQPSGEEPGPVPYSRFREVNEAYNELRGYETLAQYGFDPDSLGRLAQFEAAYVQDPHGTVAQMADNLDLPDEAKTQIRELLGTGSDESPDGGGTPSTPATDSNAVPEWAKPLLEDKERREREVVESRENAARQAALDEVLSHWDTLDKAAGIKGPREGIKLALIASHASSNAYQDTQSLAKAARQEWIGEQEETLGSAVVHPGSGIGPRSVPRSAATPAPPQSFGGDMKKASAAAMAAMERGELPTIVPGG